MDDERVGGESSSTGLTIGQFIREQCPRYLQMGMSWDEYWNGDYTRLPYYRKAYALRREEINQQLWLQGVYFIHAVGCVLSDEETYPTEPYPLTEEAARARDERNRQIEIDNARAYMETAMHNINLKRRQGGEQNG